VGGLCGGEEDDFAEAGEFQLEWAGVGGVAAEISHRIDGRRYRV